MDRKPFPKRIRLLLLLLASASCHLFWVGNAVAQRRDHSGPLKEPPSQRYLPLPQIDSVNPRQQLELLKQLNEVVTANSEASELSALGGLSSDDLKVLQDAIKQGGVEAALRSVEKSGLLPGGVTPEQVSKAMADPAIREKVKRALEQFANDGHLPNGARSKGLNGVPFPPNQTSSNRANAAVPQNKPDSDSTSNDAFAPKQQIVQSILEKHANPSDRQLNGPDGKKHSEDPVPSLNEPSMQPQTSPQRETNAASNPPNPRKANGEGINSGNRNMNPSENARTPPSRSKPVPNETTGSSNSNSQMRTDSNEKLMGTPGADSGAWKSGNTRKPVPGISSNRDRRDDVNRTSSSTNASSPSAQGTIFTDTKRDDSMDSRKAKGVADSIRNQQSSSPSSPNAADSASASSMIPHNPPSDQKPSSVDVRTDLEQRGFAETLRQLVDEARRGAENEISAQRQSGAALDDQSSWGETLKGYREAAARLPNGARNEISAASPRLDSNQPQMTPIAGTTVAPLPAASSSSELTSPTISALSRVSDVANNALSSIIAHPEPAQMIPRAVNGPMATTPGGPEVGSTEVVSVMWLGMLLALLAVGWYVGTRLVNSMFVSSQAGMIAAAQIHPADISTRRDIIRAFHQLALRPMMPVADWWTHRQVAQQVATSTPSLELPIQQFADIYEQARYLPEESVFTADQIRTARRALEQCQTSLGSDLSSV